MIDTDKDYFPNLNLGAGMKHKQGYISVDIYSSKQEQELSSIKQKFFNQDALECLKSFEADTIGNIYTRHFLEHLDHASIVSLLHEIERVLRPGGTLEIIVPHWANPYFYSDPTHLTFFGLYTFDYLCVQPYFKRRTPRYAAKHNLLIKKAELCFLGTRLLRPLHKAASSIVSSSIFFLEFYESNLVHVLPPYEIRWFLVRS